MRRLEAEMGKRAGSKAFSTDRAENDLQRALYTSRSAQLQSTVVQHNDDIRGFEAQITARQQESGDLERQLAVLRDITRVREAFYKKEQEVFQREGQFRLQHLQHPLRKGGIATVQHAVEPGATIALPDRGEAVQRHQQGRPLRPGVKNAADLVLIGIIDGDAPCHPGIRRQRQVARDHLPVTLFGDGVVSFGAAITVDHQPRIGL